MGSSATAASRRRTTTTRPRQKPKAKARKQISTPEKAIAIALVLVMLAGAYWFWFRNSSFVVVEDVAVRGVSGPEAEEVTKALTGAAAEMSVLNVDDEALAAAVSKFTTVESFTTATDFPHGLTIDIRERAPVLVAEIGGDQIPVAGDGTLLPAVDIAEGSLPKVTVDGAAAGGRISGGPLEIARVVGAAPQPLRELVTGVAWKGEQGVQVKLEGGIPLIFGGAVAAREKWDAASAVLADKTIEILSYIDLRVPERPAVGGAATALETQPSTTPLVSP